MGKEPASEKSAGLPPGPTAPNVEARRLYLPDYQFCFRLTEDPGSPEAMAGLELLREPLIRVHGDAQDEGQPALCINPAVSVDLRKQRGVGFY